MRSAVQGQGQRGADIVAVMAAVAQCAQVDPRGDQALEAGDPDRVIGAEYELMGEQVGVGGGLIVQMLQEQCGAAGPVMGQGLTDAGIEGLAEGVGIAVLDIGVDGARDVMKEPLQDWTAEV